MKLSGSKTSYPGKHLYDRYPRINCELASCMGNGSPLFTKRMAKTETLSSELHLGKGLCQRIVSLSIL